MKLTVEKQALQSGLAKALTCIERDGKTSSILNHVLFEADSDDGVSLRATDLTREICVRVQANVEAFGARAVNAALLKSFAACAQADIAMQLHGHKLVVKSGRSRLEIPTLDHEGFPSIAIIPVGKTYRFPRNEFQLALKLVSRCAAKDDKRPYLQGVYVEPVVNEDGEQKEWGFVATDANHLCYTKIDAPQGDVASAGFLYPSSSASLVSSLFPEEIGEIEVFVTDRTVTLSNDATSFTSKLMSEKYPQYLHILKRGPHEVRVSRDELLSAAEMVGLTGAQFLKLSNGVSSLRLEAMSTVNGAHGEAEVACEGALPSEFSIKPSLLSQNAGSLVGESISLYFGDDKPSPDPIGKPIKQPIVLLDKREDVVTVIMPMSG